MYKSPIELLITEVTNQIVNEQDEAIFKSILNYVPNVDRAELLRALQYDRNQYEEGYADGKADAMADLVHCRDCKYFKPAHFKADDGTETPWDETFSFDDRSDGIHYGARCKHERNTAYGLKDMAYRKADDFCSYGERKDNET